MSTKKPREMFTGVTLDQWHKDHENLTWAQREPRFRVALSVVLHEMESVASNVTGCSEGRAFGRVEGYQMALDVMRSLAMKPRKKDEPLEASFNERTDMELASNDVIE